MFEILKEQVEIKKTIEEKWNITRELLQILILKILFDQKEFDKMAFAGGTALRILYGLCRYSEDLDFSLINKKNYDFNDLLKKLETEYIKYNLKVEFTNKKDKAVHFSFIKFPDLLYQLGISENKNQKLSIRLEIDTNPPMGWKTVIRPVSDIYVFAVKTFDLPSLFATKIHACIFRRYIKGRDFYDLIWYLGKNIEPNYLLLNNAISQTENKRSNIGKDNFKSFLAERILNVDFNKVKNDVERFIEDKSELKLFDRDLILGMLS